MDVAEVSADEAWETDPFDPFIKDGWLVGRGAADMKGGLAGALFAIQLLQEAGIELPGDLIFQSVIGKKLERQEHFNAAGEVTMLTLQS